MSSHKETKMNYCDEECLINLLTVLFSVAVVLFINLNWEEVITQKNTGLKKYNANAKVAENKRVDMVS